MFRISNNVGYAVPSDQNPKGFNEAAFTHFVTIGNIVTILMYAGVSDRTCYYMTRGHKSGIVRFQSC